MHLERNLISVLYMWKNVIVYNVKWHISNSNVLLFCKIHCNHNPMPFITIVAQKCIAECKELWMSISETFRNESNKCQTFSVQGDDDLLSMCNRDVHGICTCNWRVRVCIDSLHTREQPSLSHKINVKILCHAKNRPRDAEIAHELVVISHNFCF